MTIISRLSSKNKASGELEFQLIRYFSTTSLIAFIFVTVLLGVFYRIAAVNDLVQVGESKNVALTKAFSNSLWQEFAPFLTSNSALSTEELRTDPHTANLHQAVLAQMDGLSVLKVKIYNLDGLTVFSTEESQIGEDKSSNAGFQAALSGKVASELTHRDTFSAFEETIEDRDVFSSYVPIQRDGPTGPVEGVFEIYDDVSTLLKRIGQTQRNVMVGVTAILTALYAALFFIVRHADAIIKRHHSERKRAEEALQKARDELEIKVLERTAALKKTTERLQLELSERERAEAELRETEERYRTLMENIPIGIFRNTPGADGLFLMANAAFLDIFGFRTFEELKAVSVSEFYVNSEERKQFSDNLLKKGSVTALELKLKRRDGTHIWGSVTAKVEHAENGDVVYFDQTIEDITKRKHAEQVRDESERKYRSLFESANDAIFLLSPDGIHIDANPMAAELTEYTIEELIGMTVKDLVVPYEYSDSMTKLDILMQGGSLPLYERIFRKKDGTEIPVEINVSLIRNTKGVPLYIQSIVRDISDRKRKEKELKEVNRSLRVLSQGNHVLVHSSDESNLLNDVCRVVVEDGGYRLAWVGYAQHDARRSVKVMAQAGLENGYFENLEISWDDESGHGPAGTAVRTGKPVLVKDMRANPNEFPWSSKALEKGSQACIALPLGANGHVIGALVICAEDPDSFNEEEVNLLSELAADLAYGIASLRTRTEHREASERIKRQVKNLAALRNIDIAITSSMDLRLIFDVLLSETVSTLAVDAATVLLYNPHSQSLDFIAGKGFNTAALQHTHLRLGEGHAGHAALKRRKVHIQDLHEQKTDFNRSLYLAEENFVEYFAVPLIAKGQIKGVLEIFNRSGLDGAAEWMEMLDALAGQAAIAIDNLELFQNLQQSHADLIIAYDSTLEGWSRALDLRDKETEGHTRRVAELSIRLARAMGIENGALVNIRRGALLHDIGKMGIPDKILLKPGPLNDQEWEIMQKHPVYAYDMLSTISYLRPALDIPYCHHEKWDGNGYPRGLRGEAIPVAARIFAVVDVWDALRSDRPYREAWPEEKALAYIQEQSGKHFDPKVVEVFLKLIANRKFKQ